jgi:hypothetical protein
VPPGALPDFFLVCAQLTAARQEADAAQLIRPSVDQPSRQSKVVVMLMTGCNDDVMLTDAIRTDPTRIAGAARHGRRESCVIFSVNGISGVRLHGNGARLGPFFPAGMRRPSAAQATNYRRFNWAR